MREIRAFSYYCTSNVSRRAVCWNSGFDICSGNLHRWGRARRRLDEPSRFDSEAQTAASEETARRESRRAREITRASERKKLSESESERTGGRDSNWIIQFEATGQVLIQDSYILEIQSQRINKEEQRNKRIIEKREQE
jgi:hypothetical protein